MTSKTLESQFKTMKYRHSFRDRFGALEDARAHAQSFFHWYNLEHHHSGIAMLTPHVVHYGLVADVLDNRHRVLTAAFQQHPERFVRKPPRPTPLPDAVWINPPNPSPPEGGETQTVLCGQGLKVVDKFSERPAASLVGEGFVGTGSRRRGRRLSSSETRFEST
jgi:Integrase core domain